VRHDIGVEWRERPGGWLVREAPKANVQALKQLLGIVQEGQFVTKIRKTFTRSEMNDDLRIVPAEFETAVDRSEYTEILPTSPP
jgi:phosphoserine aminotransferase